MPRWSLAVLAVTAVLIPAQNAAHANEHLRRLEWLIGQWESVPDDAQGPPFAVPDLTCEWILNHQFIIMKMNIATPTGQVVASMSGTILWDPSDQKVKYWGLGSDGRHAQAVLLPSEDNKLVWTDRLVMPDGDVRTGTFSYIRGDTEQWTLRSNGYQRADGTAEPSFQIQLRRKKER